MTLRTATRGIVLLTLAFGAAASATANLVMKDPFLGKWKVTVVPDDKGKEFKDVLTFKGGKMTAEQLEKQGWAPAEYEDDARAGAVAQFTCTLKHATEGEMKWQGQLAGSEVRGTVVWKKKTGEENYTFNGTKN